MALGYMRRHKRWLYAFLWIVILGFIVFYIPAFTGTGGAGSPGEAIATVGGETITVGEFQRAYLQRRQLYERLYQNLDPAALRALGLEEQVIDGLVTQRVLVLEAQRLGLRVSDHELARNMASAPDLQENGRFIGVDELRRRLQLQGASLAEFEEQRRSQLLIEKLQAVVSAGAIVGDSETEREYRRENETVKAEYALADAARFRAEATASDEEAKARYDANPAAYAIPERRVVQYVLVDPQALSARVTVTDRDVEVYYQEHRDEFRSDEEVCASHILVKVKATPEAAEGHPDADARRIAQGLLDRVKAGADFAAIAKASSEDKGSAPGGGDLGCFGRGRMLPEFEGAAFSLGPGETSDLVKTSFGYHVIRVASRKDQAFLPLDAVKERVRQTLLGQRARSLAEAKLGELQQALARGKGLEEVAKAAGVTLEKSAPFAKGEAPEPIGSPQLAARAFELKVGQGEPEPFGVARGAAFIALAEIQAPRTPELKEIADKVKADVSEQKAFERARALAAEVRARALQVGLEKAASAAGLVRKETPTPVGRGQALAELGTGAALEQAVYLLGEKELSEPIRVKGGYALVRVLEKKPFDAAAFEKEKGRIAAQLRDAKRNQLFQAYMSEARKRFPIERNAEAIRRVVG